MEKVPDKEWRAEDDPNIPCPKKRKTIMSVPTGGPAGRGQQFMEGRWSVLSKVKSSWRTVWVEMS